MDGTILNHNFLTIPSPRSNPPIRRIQLGIPVIREEKREMGDQMNNQKKRVMIVDDEDSITEMISDFCQMLGFEAKILNSPENIMDEVKSFHPDLITLDLTMPEFSGIEILKNLKVDNETKSIPVIIISAFVDNLDALNALNQSQGIMTKPIQMDCLKQTMERLFL